MDTVRSLTSRHDLVFLKVPSSYSPDALAPLTWRKAITDNARRTSDTTSSASHFHREAECLNRENLLQRGQGLKNRGERLLLHCGLHSLSLYPLSRTPLLLRAMLRVLNLIVLGG